MKIKLFTIFLMLIAFSHAESPGKSTDELTMEFISLFETVRQPHVAEQDLDRYFELMADDIVDYHAAYGVTITGKEAPRKNLIRKQTNNISFSLEIESMIIGSSTAVVVMNEDSEYKKQGKYKHFLGRTIAVLEFNEQGKIHAIRRYLD